MKTFINQSDLDAFSSLCNNGIEGYESKGYRLMGSFYFRNLGMDIPFNDVDFSCCTEQYEESSSLVIPEGIRVDTIANRPGWEFTIVKGKLPNGMKTSVCFLPPREFEYQKIQYHLAGMNLVDYNNREMFLIMREYGMKHLSYYSIGLIYLSPID